MNATHETSTTPPRRGRALAIALAVALPLAAVGGYLGWQALQPGPAPTEFAGHSLLQLDLSRPDALIESASLSQLPRDVLKIPLLREVLTEDFVFYYETNADRLGLAGTLRRIAYEHELDLRDSVIDELLDEPADIALWRAEDGKLRHALLLLQRGSLAKMLQPLATAAASDTQLTAIGTLIVRGDEVPVYRLRYNYDRAIAFAAHGDRLVVLSSADMLQSTEAPESLAGKAEADVIARLLAGKVPYAERFGLDDREATHRVTVSADYLGFGYARFVPQLAGVRLEMDDSTWSSHLALSGRAAPDDFEFAPLWQAMPIGASACAAVPVSADALQPVLARLTTDETLPAELARRLVGPAALCWYGKSRLHTPLLVTRLGAAAANAPADAGDADAQLEQTFTSMIGTFEPNATGEDGRFPVDRQQSSTSTRWQRIVGSTFGLHPDSELEDPESIASSHFFRVTLARHGDVVLFSLDDALVDQALATLDKRFPPLAEQLPKDGRVPAYVAPAALAALLEQETLASLPADVEAVFRNAAETHLLPKLREMGQQNAYAVTLPADGRVDGDWTWVPLQWNAL